MKIVYARKENLTIKKVNSIENPLTWKINEKFLVPNFTSKSSMTCTLHIIAQLSECQICLISLKNALIALRERTLERISRVEGNCRINLTLSLFQGCVPKRNAVVQKIIIWNRRELGQKLLLISVSLSVQTISIPTCLSIK